MELAVDVDVSLTSRQESSLSRFVAEVRSRGYQQGGNQIEPSRILAINVSHRAHGITAYRYDKSLPFEDATYYIDISVYSINHIAREYDIRDLDDDDVNAMFYPLSIIDNDTIK